MSLAVLFMNFNLAFLRAISDNLHLWGG